MKIFRRKVIRGEVFFEMVKFKLSSSKEQEERATGLATCSRHFRGVRKNIQAVLFSLEQKELLVNNSRENPRVWFFEQVKAKPLFIDLWSLSPDNPHFPFDSNSHTLYPSVHLGGGRNFSHDNKWLTLIIQRRWRGKFAFLPGYFPHSAHHLLSRALSWLR